MNIVFDLGGVVFNWQPRKLVRRLFADTAARELVIAEIFGSADWIELDRGTLCRDEAIVRGASRTGIAIEDIARLFAAVPASLTPINETIDLIRSLDRTDHRLYVLSNMHTASIDHLEKHHDIWDLFDGIVISSRVRMVKPEPGIYRYVLNQFELCAEQTVFIDDLPENLTAAASVGIRTILFENAARCREDLIGLECL